MAYTAIDDPSAYFKVQLYTGTGSSNAITFNDTDTDMQPDLVWVKKRDATGDHYANDSVRGVTKKIEVNSTSAEETDTNSLTAFGSDGFTVGSTGAFNSSSNTFVAWCWKESAVSGFDIVAYEGNATAKTVSHSLSAVPHVMLAMNRDSANNKHLYHHKNTSAPETDYLNINTTGATDDALSVWNDTAPTSSVFTVGDGDTTNNDGDSIIAYLFSEKQGFSKFGTYVGNSNVDGAFVYTGFKPAFVMTKASENTSGSNNWFMADNKRHSVAPASGGTNFNVIDRQLYANLNNADDTNSSIDFLSNGFKWRRDGGDTNTTGRTFVYMAFAEAPFVNSNGVPCNAR